LKLLLDENLSRRMLGLLLAPFPGSTHVALVGLQRASDAEIWEFARANDFVIASRDADFYERSLISGQPPKVVWLNCGNLSTDAMTNLLLTNAAAIEAFSADPAVACLEVA
jgi:predicted nuclease of predicted toxin-antitoxin system